MKFKLKRSSMLTEKFYVSFFKTEPAEFENLADLSLDSLFALIYGYFFSLVDNIALE